MDNLKEYLEALPDDLKKKAEKDFSGLVKLDEVDKDGFEKILKENESLNSVFQSKLSQKNADYDKRFNEEKLPELERQLKEKIMAELNPPKTEAEKRLAELEVQLRAMQEEKLLVSKKEQRRQEAKAEGFDPELAGYLVGLSDEAFKQFSMSYKLSVQKAVEEQLKQKLPSIDVKAGASAAPPDPSKMSIIEATKLARAQGL